jgi:hypothetical protein
MDLGVVVVGGVAELHHLVYEHPRMNKTTTGSI